VSGYRKNVASQNLPFCLVNASTGAALTGATVTARRSIDGGAQANATGSVSELANGQYNLALSQADTNGNQIGILLTATGAIPAHFVLVTTAGDPTDAVRGGLTALPNAAAEAAGGLYTRGTGAGQINQPANGLIDVNVENWNTTAVPAEHTAGYPIVTVKDGTGTGEIDTTSGGVLVAALAANAITATAIATDAITAAKIATGAIDADAIADNAVTEIQAAVAAGAVASVTGSVGSVASGGIAEASYAADTRKYGAKVGWIDDNTGTADRYLVIYYRNGEPVTSGITNPDLWVYKNDNSSLVGTSGSPQALTQIGSTGTYTHDETTNRIVSGAAYIARVRATIDGSTRTWYQFLGAHT
jgi:hypothetical protein